MSSTRLSLDSAIGDKRDLATILSCAFATLRASAHTDNAPRVARVLSHLSIVPCQRPSLLPQSLSLSLSQSPVVRELADRPSFSFARACSERFAPIEPASPLASSCSPLAWLRGPQGDAPEPDERLPRKRLGEEVGHVVFSADKARRDQVILCSVA